MRRTRELGAAVRRRVHVRRWTVLAAFFVLLALVLDADTVRRTPTEEAVFRDRFGLVEWMGLNLLDGAQDALFDLLPGGVPFESERRAAVERYFELGDRARRIEGSLRLAVAQEGAAANPLAADLQAELDRLRRERSRAGTAREHRICRLRRAPRGGPGARWSARPLCPARLLQDHPRARLIVFSPRDRYRQTRVAPAGATLTPLP